MKNLILNKGLKRHLPIERDEKELEEVTGQSDHLNHVFSYFDSRFQAIWHQITKKEKKKVDKSPPKSSMNLNSMSLKEMISKLKRKNKLIEIAYSTEKTGQKFR